MESEEQDEYSGSGASTPENSEASLPSESVHEDENSGNLKISTPPTVSLITQKESCMNYDNCNYPKSRNHLVTAEEGRIHESAIDNSNSGVLPAKETSKDSGHLHCDDNTHMCGSEMMDVRSNNLEGATDMVAVVSPVRDQCSQEASGDSNSEEENRQTDMQLEENNERMSSRSADAVIKSKSLSPDIDSKSGNKRPAIICDFFARGWCIKGSSCRFVHKKDHVDSNMRPPDEEVAVVVSEREMELVEGSKDVCERSRLPGFPESLASSAGNYDACSSPFSLQRTLIREHGGRQRFQLNDKHNFSSLERGDSTSSIPLDHQLLASLKGDPGCISSFNDVDRERLRHMLPTNENRASLINRGSSTLLGNYVLHENGSGSSDSVITLRTNHHGASSYASSFGELVCNGRQFMHNDTSLSSPSLKPNSNTFPLNPAMLSSRHLRKSFSPLNAAPSHVQKLLDSDRDFASRSASLMQSTSPFSASKPECLSPTKVSRDPLHCGEFKSRIPKYNWEPSVPFRPSFFIPPSILSTGSLYDPLRDSIEESNVGDTSTVNTSLQHTCQNSGLFGNQGIDGTIANHSLSSHNRINENTLDKNCQKHEKGFLLTGVETVGFSDVDQQSGTLGGEENPSGPLNIDCDATNQSHGARQKKDKRVDQTRQNIEVDVDSKRDRDMPKESKALRHLRAALVDMVKDLLKPTWHEGRLSKDAHNVIVKKAVEKVLSTLQPNQISTMESMKQYLSSSQPKIAKLVEAYVEKYGKS